MENSNINIRLLKETDIDQINAFHNRIYNDDRTNEKFKWEFYDAPAGKAIYVVAEDTGKNKIIGTQCAIPIYLKSASGQLILSAKSEDTLVDPEYRGMQLFEKMYDFLFDKCKKEGIKYIWGFTPALKPFLKIGFDSPYSHHQSLRVINISTSYNYISGLNPKNKSADKLKILIMTLVSKAFHIQSDIGSFSQKDFNLKISQNVESDLEKLWKLYENTDSDLFHIYEDKNYIEWRINNNPYHKKVLSFDFIKDNQYAANLIFNHHKDDVWYMVQAIFDQNLPAKTQGKLISLAINELIRNENAKLIRTWNFNTNLINKKEVSIYKKAGFLYISKGVHFVWKDLTAESELKPENFYLSRIATQGVI